MIERECILAESNGVGEWVAHLSPRERERERLGMILEEMHQRGVSIEEVWRRFKAGEFEVAETEVTLGRAVNEFLASLKTGGWSAKTITDRKERLRSSRAVVRECSCTNCGSPCSTTKWPVTRHQGDAKRQWLDCGRSFPSACGVDGSRANRATRWSVTVRYRAPVSLSVSEARAIMEATRAVAPRMIPVVVLSLFAGLRPDSEARLMRWEWIKLDGGYLIKPASIGKMNDERRVNLPANAVECLRLGGPLPMTTAVRRKQLLRIREAAGVKTWVNDIITIRLLIPQHQLVT